MYASRRVPAVTLILATVVAVSVCLPVAAEDSADATGLRVEQVLWKPDGSGGGVIEVSYKLIAVTELPRHPSITYILDHQGGNKLELQRVAMIPPTEMNPDEAPVARFELQDPEGLYWPGDSVTVVIAGLVQEGVVISGEVPEGYGAQREDAEAAAATVETEPSDAKLEVVKLMVAGGGALLDLRYRLSGVSLVQADERDSYILIPETGEKFYVLGVARIGTLATKDPGAAKTSFILIQNSERKIKVGDRVTVVISGAKAENVLVEDPIDG